MKKIIPLFLTILTLSFHLGCITSSTTMIIDEINLHPQVQSDKNPNGSINN